MSTTKGFYTFRASDFALLTRYPWDSGGGLSSPVIGQQGQVYAIVGNYLFVFAGPATPGSSGCDVFAAGA